VKGKKCGLGITSPVPSGHPLLKKGEF